MTLNSQICRLCKSEFVPCYGDRINSRMILRELCFDCNHWDELAFLSQDRNSVRINGHQYWIQPPADPALSGEFSGFKKSVQKIQFIDGRKVETTNLWYQGEIPVAFRLRMPNNAQWAESLK